MPKEENFSGQHGWREFHRNRKDILGEFDKIIEQTSSRPIKVAHGVGVEAFLRKWLFEFLPKKYGVTSGYIIPNLYQDNGVIYHFDIIIYEKLESPILWTESNEDASENGKSRAIPAKHVVGVFEVKSRFNKKNVTSSLEKLNQVIDFKEQLHKCFSSGIIFIELKEENINHISPMKELLKGHNIFGFKGGIVLRFEGDETCSGIISINNTDPNDPYKNFRLKPLAMPIDDIDAFRTEDGNIKLIEPSAGMTVTIGENNTIYFSKQYGISYSESDKEVSLKWSRSNFANFCINLIANLDGVTLKKENEIRFGQIYDNFELRKAPNQSLNQIDGKPFLKVRLNDNSDSFEKLKINLEEKSQDFEVQILIENHGLIPVEISTDSFKSKFIVESKIIASCIKKFNLTSKRKYNSLKESFNKEPTLVPFRLVYRPTDNLEEFYGIEKNIKITDNSITLIDNN